MLPVILPCGNGFTTTVVGLEVAEQLFPSVTVTVYEPAIAKVALGLVGSSELLV